ncbi:MAG: hypothetical protein JWN92_1527 [Candidatus Acidoferrum typicum]|nr:hypothetical protein [Candidatus Acidoferrum typicum]
MRRDSKRGTRRWRAPFEFRVASQFESKPLRPEEHGTERPLENHVAILGFALVAAARFLGGQLFRS